ncbi:MAG: UbiA-like polyprenyltransferase [Planctomycetota bacterium]
MAALRPVLAALRDIKLAHTVFALPFALLAAFLARPLQPIWDGPPPEEGALDSLRGMNTPDRYETDWRSFSLQLVLIVLCMFFARTWAMLVNRLADATFDAQNPRTAGRAVAAGTLSPRTGWLIALTSAAAFWLTTLVFLAFSNPWPPILAPVALIWIALYAYTKRFTALCHLFLGAALAISPVCAAIAVDPSAVLSFSSPTLVSLLFLSAFITCWVAGFDIPYALADIDIDRTLNLHSIPARFGVARALVISRALHALAIVALVAFAVLAPPLGPITLVAAGAVAGLLFYEHLVLARRGVAGLPIAFFTVNGVISILFSGAAIIDTLV